MKTSELHSFFRSALNEDVREGDHTTLATVPANHAGVAVLRAKEDGVIAGVEVAKSLLEFYDPGLKVQASIDDGYAVSMGAEILKISGSTRSILTTERLMLNLMQRMSGVASITKKYVDCIAHTKAKVLDTRKTTPGIRWFEKEAVRLGGGVNHRFGLFDMILIKDNHVDAAGGVQQALEGVKTYLDESQKPLKVELEVRSIAELEEALSYEVVDRIMLDNFSVQATEEAVAITNGRKELESSGGITLETIGSYAETGVDFVSVGALTHSVKALDMSLLLDE